MYFGPVPVHAWLLYIFWCQSCQFFTGLLVQLMLDFQTKQAIGLKAYFGVIASAWQPLASEYCKCRERTALPADMIMYKTLGLGFLPPKPCCVRLCRRGIQQRGGAAGGSWCWVTKSSSVVQGCDNIISCPHTIADVMVLCSAMTSLNKLIQMENNPSKTKIFTTYCPGFVPAQSLAGLLAQPGVARWREGTQVPRASLSQTLESSSRGEGLQERLQ